MKTERNGKEPVDFLKVIKEVERNKDEELKEAFKQVRLLYLGRGDGLSCGFDEGIKIYCVAKYFSVNWIKCKKRYKTEKMKINKI